MRGLLLFVLLLIGAIGVVTFFIYFDGDEKPKELIMKNRELTVKDGLKNPNSSSPTVPNPSPTEPNPSPPPSSPNTKKFQVGEIAQYKEIRFSVQNANFSVNHILTINVQIGYQGFGLLRVTPTSDFTLYNQNGQKIPIQYIQKEKHPDGSLKYQIQYQLTGNGSCEFIYTPSLYPNKPIYIMIPAESQTTAF